MQLPLYLYIYDIWNITESGEPEFETHFKEKSSMNNNAWSNMNYALRFVMITLYTHLSPSDS